MKRAALFAGVLATASFLANQAAAETLACAPRYPTFCANAHVACVGRSRLPAQAFTVAFEGPRATISFADGAVVEAGVAMSESGRVLRVEGEDWWIRIDPAGRFSQRVYAAAGALMSVGICRG